MRYAVGMSSIRIQNTRFCDASGRTLLLRGVNLGGSTKVPVTPDGATHRVDRFFDHREVSFVGRPFPLDEADEHFTRLKRWGFTFLRFLVTWEAIEHDGPGEYDQAYLDYVRAVVERAGEHGIDVFIDPHQDVWSRFSGGDGAPGWTLDAVGFDMTRFKATGAAIVHATHGDPFPRMIWPTNATKLAAGTMFTLFFGGNDFAPQTHIDGEPVQDYLQRHYIAAIQQVARRLKGLPNVVGYDTMNEPFPGFIGWKDLRRTGGLLRLGDTPSPYQAMLLGSGYPQRVDRWVIDVLGLRKRGTRLLNQQRASAWRDGTPCVWQCNGVWEADEGASPRLLRPDHFARVHGREVNFARDYYRPFANRYAAGIREVDPEALIFVEAETGQQPPPWRDEDAPNVAFAAHWYDGFVLFTKRYSSHLAVDYRTTRPVFGSKRIRASFADQIRDLKQGAAETMGGVPALIGEFGIPFDLNGGKAFRTGDFGPQIAALDRSFRAIEDNLLSCTLWNYTADNTNLRGDQWNGEDLSVFSRDQQTDPGNIHSGGRALEAVVRPYARAIAGAPLAMSYDLGTKTFCLSFRHDPEVQAPTEIFVPELAYPHGFGVTLSDGRYTVDEGEQLLVFHHDPDQAEHTIRIRPA